MKSCEASCFAGVLKWNLSGCYQCGERGSERAKVDILFSFPCLHLFSHVYRPYPRHKCLSSSPKLPLAVNRINFPISGRLPKIVSTSSFLKLHLMPFLITYPLLKVEVQCYLDFLIAFIRRYQLLLIHVTLAGSELSALMTGSTLYGAEVPFWLDSQHSHRCVFLCRSTTKWDQK